MSGGFAGRLPWHIARLGRALHGWGASVAWGRRINFSHRCTGLVRGEAFLIGDLSDMVGRLKLGGTFVSARGGERC